MSTEEYRASLKEKIPYGMYFFEQGMIYTLVLHGLRISAYADHIGYHVRGKNLGRYQ